MKVSRIVATGVAVTLLSVGIPAAAHAAEVTLRGDWVIPSGTVIDGDLKIVDGYVTVQAGAVVAGDLIVRNGDARVMGTVVGSVRQSGPGGVVVGENGRVNDGVVEVGDGNVSVSGRVFGSAGIVERDAGDVTVRGQVESVNERGEGTVRVRDGLYSEVRGSIKEYDAGDVIVFLDFRDGDTVVRGTAGSVNENGDGGIIVLGEVGGNVREKGAGNLTVRETALIEGNVVESEGGDVLIHEGSQIGGIILETGDGSVVSR